MDFEPCKTCPWRRSSTVGGADIPGFSIDLMRKLRNTVGPGDAFRPIMACHYSPEGDETPCRGYIAQVGYTNLTVRVLAARGKIPIPKIEAACAKLELWPSFEVMLRAYEGVRRCRDCGETKPRSEFPETLLGSKPFCKACKREKERVWRVARTARRKRQGR